MLRIAVRLLLPYCIRRPIADRVYRLIAWSNHVNGSAHVNRSGLVSILYSPARYLLARAWSSTSASRYLLGCDLRHLTLKQRLQRRALMTFLAFPDWYYRRGYTRFGKALTKFKSVRGPVSDSGIVLVIGTLGPGGSERQAVLTLTGFAKRGHEPLHLICSFLRNASQRFFLPCLEAANVPVSELDRDPVCDGNCEITPLLQTARNLPSSIREVTDYIRTVAVYQPKIIHLWLDDVNVKGGLAATALGIPRIVLGLRSLPPCNFALHQPYMREGYRWLAKRPGVVLLNNSAAGARAYEEWLGLSEGSIRVVHNGFDFEPVNNAHYGAKRDCYRACHKIPAKAPVLGTVIRLGEEKRPLLWLEIAAEVRRRLPDARFLIVGDGPLRGAMEARAADNDLRGAVHFTGHEQDAFAAIAAMDIFLLTSRAEGLPNVLMEAQALGVPVVTTNVGGAPETVQHGLSGWVLEQDNPAYAADVLVRLFGDRAWRSKARAEAPKFVRRNFGVERMLDETLAIYHMGIDDFMTSRATGIIQ